MNPVNDSVLRARRREGQNGVLSRGWSASVVSASRTLLNRSAFRNRAITWLHCFAAAILLLFAMSHFAFFSIDDLSRHLDNRVFPFLRNGTLYLVAGIVEMAVGILCLRFRARDFTNVVILMFVAILVWYGWAFRFMGGSACGCLGLFGKLAHLTRTQERMIRILALVALTVSAAPWLLGTLVSLGRRVLGCLPVLLMLVLQQAHAEQMIQVNGEVETVRYDPKRRAALTNSTMYVEFQVLLSGNTWKICTTNLNDRQYWAWLIYNGTNTIMLTPYGKDFGVSRPETNLVFACVSKSPFYETVLGDRPGLSIVWLTYGLIPQIMRPNDTGLVGIPVPWLGSHFTLSAYGYNWVATSKDGRFVEDCKLIRDSRLDLDEKQELLRPGFDHPTSANGLEMAQMTLAARRAVPDGFVESTYSCTRWYGTNGLRIPVASEFRRYASSVPDFPVYESELKAAAVTLRNELEEFLPLPRDPTVVWDYRYKRVTKTHIFKYAEYVLEPGDSWKSDSDPILMAQAEEWLKHGRKYDDLGGKRRRVTVWLMLAALVLPPAVFIALKLTKQKRIKQ